MGFICFSSPRVPAADSDVTAATNTSPSLVLSSIFPLPSYRHIEEDGNADVLDTAEDDGEQARGGQLAAGMFSLTYFVGHVGMKLSLARPPFRLPHARFARLGLVHCPCWALLTDGLGREPRAMRANVIDHSRVRLAGCILG